MRSFERWFNEQGRDEKPEELCPDGVHESSPGKYVARCRVCDQLADIECDLKDFDPNMHYCGGSPACCP